MSASIAATVNRADFVKALTASLKFASKDDTLPMIAGVQVSVVDGKLKLGATDRFRVGVFRLPLDDVLGAAPGTVAFLPASHATRIVRWLGAMKVGRRSADSGLRIAVRITADSLTITDAGDQLATKFGATANMPALDKLIRDTLDAAADVEAGKVPPRNHASYNVSYLADFRHAQLGRDYQIRMQVGASEGRPTLVTIGDYFLGLLMPVRDADGGSRERVAVRESWSLFLAVEPDPVERAAPTTGPLSVPDDAPAAATVTDNGAGVTVNA